jgi:hypothetical protein
MYTQLQSTLHIFQVEGDKLTDQKAGKIVNDVDTIKWIKEQGKENAQYVVLRVYTKTSF